MKEFLFRGEYQNEDGELYYCAHYINEAFFEETIPEKRSPAMTNGLYFETKTLGSGARGKVEDLPRLNSGKKSIAQERIDQQILAFKMIVQKHKMHVVKEGDERNTQVILTKQWEHKDFDNVILRGTLDIYDTPFLFDKELFMNTVVDLKLTANIHSKFGVYSWGNPFYMDHTQAYLYTYLSGYPFFYLVFDYKPKPEYKPIFVSMDGNKYAELNESIRKVADRIVHHKAWGFETNPQYNRCRYCPLNYVLGGSCNEAKTVQVI